MTTWKQVFMSLRSCIDKTPPGSLERLAGILDCYEKKASQMSTRGEFPKSTPDTIQSISIVPNGKDTLEVLLYLMDLIPPEQFLYFEENFEPSELRFRGDTLQLIRKTTPEISSNFNLSKSQSTTLE